MGKATGRTKAPAQTPKVEVSAAWLNVDETTAKAAGAAYNEWQKAQELADTKKFAFEEAFVTEARKRGSLPEGKTLKFSYRFGIGVQMVDDDGRPRGKRGNNSFQM
jgi:hypothetical protein